MTRPVAKSRELRSDYSTEQAIHLRQELSKVELGRASGAGGAEVGSLPVSLFLRELGIGVTCMAAGAMMLVVGQEAGQIAQRARRSLRRAGTGRRRPRT